MHYLLAGIIGLASGIIMVTTMVFLLSPPVRDIPQTVGPSLLVIIPAAQMGYSKHFTHENIDWRTALSLAPLAIAGSCLGAWLTTHIAADKLTRAFGEFMIVVGVKLLCFK
jgi:uncharacterized protein